MTLNNDEYVEAGEKNAKNFKKLYLETLEFE